MSEEIKDAMDVDGAAAAGTVTVAEDEPLDEFQVAFDAVVAGEASAMDDEALIAQYRGLLENARTDETASKIKEQAMYK
jgi:hypothetical protein